MKTREYQYDNIRFILIFLVVMGHLLELSTSIPFQTAAYKCIYTFHMPAFLFLSGMFASFRRSRIVFSLLMPYLVAQVAYRYFESWLSGSDLHLTFLQPFWLLWYLFALLIYHCLLPFYDTDSPRTVGLLLLGAVTAALLSGFDKGLAFPMAFSRVAAFQPWFLLGFYWRKFPRLQSRFFAAMESRGTVLRPALVVMLMLCWRFWSRDGIPADILYNSHPYSMSGISVLLRTFAMITALPAIALLLWGGRRFLHRRIPVISCIGQNSFSVFLLHGFAVWYLRMRHPMQIHSAAVLLLTTAVLLVLFGNRWVGAFFKFTVGGGWFFSMCKRGAGNTNIPLGETTSGCKIRQ